MRRAAQLLARFARLGDPGCGAVVGRVQQLDEPGGAFATGPSGAAPEPDAAPRRSPAPDDAGCAHAAQAAEPAAPSTPHARRDRRVCRR